MNLLTHHPLVKKVVCAELLPERRKSIEDMYGIKTYGSYDEIAEKEPELTVWRYLLNVISMALRLLCCDTVGG